MIATGNHIWPATSFAVAMARAPTGAWQPCFAFGPMVKALRHALFAALTAIVCLTLVLAPAAALDPQASAEGPWRVSFDPAHAHAHGSGDGVTTHSHDHETPDVHAAHHCHHSHVALQHAPVLTGAKTAVHLTWQAADSDGLSRAFAPDLRPPRA